MKNKQSKQQQKVKPSSSKTKTKVTSENKQKNTISYILVFLLPILLYLHTITYGFTKLDDDLIIQNNIKFLSDFGNVFKSFLTDQFIDRHTTFYRPIGTLSYMFDIQISGGNNVWMYHLSNILILGLTSFFLFLLLIRFGFPKKIAMFGTLIYYIHPLFVSTAAHIPNRSELLLSLFSIISFLCFIEFLHKNKIKYLLGHWLAFSVALFCKETAVFLSFIFLFYFLIFLYKKPSKNWGNQTKYFYIAFLDIISVIFWYYLRSIALQGITDQNNKTFGLNPFISNLRVIPEAIAKFFLPIDISPIPAYSVLNTIVGLALIALMIFLFFKNKERSKKEKGFWFLWFFVLLIPSMLYKHPNLDYFDHRFFLPMIGILFFVLIIMPKKWGEDGNIKNNSFFIITIIVLSSITFLKSQSYSDPMTFYSAAISKNPKSDFAFNNRGLLYNSQGKYNEAINDYTRAIELKPNEAKVYNNRGLAYGNLGLFDKSINDLTKAVEINPSYAEAYINRGNSYNDIGLFDKAICDFKKAIELTPNYPIIYYNMGLAYNNWGLQDSAINNFTKAIKLKSDYAEAYNNRGVLYSNKNMNDSACQNFKKAMMLGNQTAKNNFIKNCK